VQAPLRTRIILILTIGAAFESTARRPVARKTAHVNVRLRKAAWLAR
jgi:hypothetical protein